MADQVPNIALGRNVELYKNVDENNPATAILTMVVVNTTATDATLKDLDTIADIIADVNTAEVTNTNYARIDLTDTDLVAFAPDDTNDQAVLDIPDQTYTAIAAGDAWTDLFISYDALGTGVDANLEPMTQQDLIATPDGSDIVVQFPNGIFVAS